MADYPLLVFPTPSRAERAKRTGFPSGGRRPSSDDQARRLAPQFHRLQEAIERKRIALQDNPSGILPEQVLVLETIGSIQDFVNIIRWVDGLEWLGEFEQEDMEPEHGFEDESNPDRRLRGQLFLIMTDQRALDEFRSLFDRWRVNPDEPFPYGRAKLKSAFVHLYDIRPWDAEDRIRETGILDDWESRLNDDSESVPFEAELWFRSDEQRRNQAESYVRSIIESMDGEVVQQCVIPEISYHAILGRVSRANIREIVGRPETWEGVRLLQCEDIMHLRPVGQCAVTVPEDVVDIDAPEAAGGQGDATKEPLVALLDGMPLTGHQLLDSRITVDDPDDYESAYQANERLHGTHMASLICHGDLNEHGPAVGRRLYVRPIMQPRRSLRGLPAEAIPLNVLPVDLIHRAVRRLYESESGSPPTAPSVRVINLSIGDPSRSLHREVGPIARLLDWLTWKYNILFIVSAGNHPRDVKLGLTITELMSITDEVREQLVVKSIADDTRHRRLLSPAETLNGLTLGASHSDLAPTSPNPRHINPLIRQDLPSVISAHGPGYRRSVKPDILLPGGRQFLSENLGNNNPNAVLGVTKLTTPPGQLVATPGTAGRLDQKWYTRGTSNASALASRGAHFLYDVLEELRSDSGASLPVEYDAVLLKTLLVHGADWAGAWSLYQQTLLNGQNGRTFRDYVGRFLGYGTANLQKVMTCTAQRVTVVGNGTLGDGEGDVFTLPLPPSLSAISEWRRLTITLAWLTPVNSKLQNYRVAHLWFDPKKGNTLAPDRQNADFRASQRGTVQHEILEGTRAVPFQDGDCIAIKVNCRSDAGKLMESVRYGLAVTLEVGKDVGIPVYQEILARLPVPIRV